MPVPSSPAARERRHVRVEGRVQGVGFRDACVDAARACGVAGWVRNRRDGSVEVVTEGSSTAVARLLAWLQKGPAYARVDHVVTLDASEADTAAPLPAPFERRPSA